MKNKIILASVVASLSLAGFAASTAQACLSEGLLNQMLSARGTPGAWIESRDLDQHLCEDTGQELAKKPAKFLITALRSGIYSPYQMESVDLALQTDGDMIRYLRDKDVFSMSSDGDTSLLLETTVAQQGAPSMAGQVAGLAKKLQQQHLKSRDFDVNPKRLIENLPFIVGHLKTANPKRDEEILRTFALKDCSRTGVALSALFIEPGQMTILAREIQPLLRQKIAGLKNQNHLENGERRTLDDVYRAEFAQQCEKTLELLVSRGNGEKIQEKELESLRPNARAVLAALSKTQLSGGSSMAWTSPTPSTK